MYYLYLPRDEDNNEMKSLNRDFFLRNKERTNLYVFIKNFEYYSTIPRVFDWM